MADLDDGIIEWKEVIEDRRNERGAGFGGEQRAGGRLIANSGQFSVEW